MAPERHYLPNCKQALLLTKTYCTVNIRLRRCACCTPRKVSSWDGEVIRYPAHLGVTALAKHLVT